MDAVSGLGLTEPLQSRNLKGKKQKKRTHLKDPLSPISQSQRAGIKKNEKRRLKKGTLRLL
jgi:hypothetical protein